MARLNLDNTGFAVVAPTDYEPHGGKIGRFWVQFESCTSFNYV
jgi:hypothetical protein